MDHLKNLDFLVLAGQVVKDPPTNDPQTIYLFVIKGNHAQAMVNDRFSVIPQPP